VPLHEAHDGPVVEANDSVHELESSGRSQRPSLGQHFVINILEAEAGDLAKHIERIENLLNVDHAHVHGPVVLVDDGFERGRGGAVASAGVEEQEINCRHDCFIPMSYLCHARALKR
jgi:hypothetical protein